MSITPFVTTVGVFDSGVGGLSILAELVGRFPSTNFVYLADSAGFPYATKTEQEIQARVKQGVDQLVRQGCTGVIIACNTASVYALDTVRRAWPQLPIVGTVPAIKPAHEASTTGSIFVLVTDSTAGSAGFRDFVQRLDTSHRVQVIGTTALVAAIEANDLAAVKQEVTNLAQQYDFSHSSLVLGCTHFPLVQQIFERVLPPSVRLWSPSQGVASQAQRVFGLSTGDSTLGTVRFLSTRAGEEARLAAFFSDFAK